MRPVNLLPEGAAVRAGAGVSSENRLGYAVVGLLVVVLVAVFAMVHFSNQVGEKQDEIAKLEATEAETQARAASLTQFTNFQLVREERQATITALAESRFDWERVMRELSLVLPKRVWLTNLTGTVDPAVAVENAAASTLRASVPGPALQLVGCARSQRDVARLISSLEDMDGVTRVTIEDSVKPDNVITAGAEGEANSGDDCRTRDFVTQFHAVAAFDAVSVPEGAAPTVPTTPEATTAAAPAETTTTTTASTDTPTAAGKPASEQEGVDAAKQDAGKALDLIGAGEGKAR